jgi:ParB-like nuclease domain
MGQRTVDAKPELTKVPIDKIVDNPMLVTRHAIDKAKVAALAESVSDIGFFEGIHARKKGGDYELMFGHHRVAACKKAGKPDVHLIVRPYTDLEMITGFSRENESSKNVKLDHFLESWMAMAAYLYTTGKLARVRAKSGNAEENERDMAVAVALGKDSWTVDGKLNHQARACASAAATGLPPKALIGLSVDRGSRTLSISKRFARLIGRYLEDGLLTKQEHRQLSSALQKGMEDVLAMRDEDGDPLRKPELEREATNLVFHLQGELDIMLNAKVEGEEFDEAEAAEEVEEELSEEYEDAEADEETDEKENAKYEAERQRRLAHKELESAVNYITASLDRAASMLDTAAGRLVMALRKAPADAETKAMLRVAATALRQHERQAERLDKAIHKGLDRPVLKAV